MKKIAVMVAILCAGCSQPVRETVMRIDTIKVPVSVVDSLYLERTDTCYVAGDRIIDIRIDTVWKKVWYHIHDTIPLLRIDTLQVYKEVIVEETTMRKIGRYAVGAAVGFGLCVIFYVIIILIKR